MELHYFQHKDIFLVLTIAILFTSLASGLRTKRMYALCPPQFTRIGNECYFVSTDSVNWLDAHFECKERNGRLAEPEKIADTRLRKYLQYYDQNRTEKWIGGIYNWERYKWQWGYNGRAITYQSFSQMMPGSSQNLKFHCAVLNPQLKYRWSARSCSDKHQFVCQHRMPYVNQENRINVYRKWNETYPNEMANEVEDIINPDDRRRNYRQKYRRMPQNYLAENQTRIRNNNRYKDKISRHNEHWQQHHQNRIHSRTPRKHNTITANDVLNNNGPKMTNDVPIVESVEDPNIRIIINNTTSLNKTNPKKIKKPKQIYHPNETHKSPGRKRRVKRPLTTSRPLDGTKPTPHITKEEMRKKQEDRRIWDKEQQRLRETKKMLDEQAAKVQMENEMKKRQEVELERETEIFNREYKKHINEHHPKGTEIEQYKQEILRNNDEKRQQEEVEERRQREEDYRRQKEEHHRAEKQRQQKLEKERRQQEEYRRQEQQRRNDEEQQKQQQELDEQRQKEDQELQRQKEDQELQRQKGEQELQRQKKDHIMELMKMEQEKIRQQQEKNYQIEERIRLDEERKREEKLAKHQHQQQNDNIHTVPILINENNVPTNIQPEQMANVNEENQSTPFKINDTRIDKRRKEENERLRREKLRKRLQNLSPDQLKEFFEKRAERNRKNVDTTTANK